MRDRIPLLLGLVTLVLAGIAWKQGGFNLAQAGLLDGAQTLLLVTPLLLAAFLIAGLVQTLVGAQVVELGVLNATIHKVNECVRVEDIDALHRMYFNLLANLLA